MQQSANRLIAAAIERPVGVCAVVAMVVLFGLIALQAIPIQLAPDVNRPVITITTLWPGAAPAEVEREILNKQEQELSGLENLRTITGRAETGRCRITLEFDVGTDMDKALLLVSNRLDRISSYPNEADSPQLDTAGTDDDAIAWFTVVREPGNNRPIHEYRQFVEDVIKERIERVPGIARVNIYGGSDPEIQIIVEPEKLAQYRITVGSVIQALRSAHISVSAGDVEEGKRRYIVRAEGELKSGEDISEIVIRPAEQSANGRSGRVTLSDIAVVQSSYKTPTAIIRVLGEPALPFNATRQSGANIIATMNGIREAVDELQRTAIPGTGLKLQQVYDETVYVNSAIDLVQQNIWVGGMLAAMVMLLFLRSIRATLMISLAIPVSIIGAFVAMAALGRSINVVSLAGLAFAVGIVVDSAIVILENIFRLREAGESARKAALRGANQVWGAVLVSALTTVMVFIPVLISQLEVGQLFRDIAVAISVAVLLSLLVSITVIPTFASALLRLRGDQRSIVRLRLPVIDALAERFVAFIIGFTRLLVRRRLLAFIWVSAVAFSALFLTVKFLPNLEYLPEGNNNLVFGLVVPPPGYNLQTTTEIAGRIEDTIRPHWVTADSSDAQSSAAEQPVKIKRFFFVSTRAQMFVGAISNDPERVSDLIPILQKPVFQEPGTYGFMSQPSIFGRGIGAGRKIELDISGATLSEILLVASRAAEKILGELPRSEGHQFRPNPGLELGVPEIRILPDRKMLADNGLSALELSLAVDVFNDGMKVEDTIYEGRETDITLLGPKNQAFQTQTIKDLPVVTPQGQIIPVESVAHIDLTAGPTEIRHREGLRTITLEIRPAPLLTMEEAIDIVQNQVIEPLKAEGVPNSVKFKISGTADTLKVTWNAMILDVIVALIIVYLVMAILFENFVYPLIILLSIPVAAAGGVGGLAVLNLYVHQPLDMLTLLGFVILIGIVVNNAILIVHQSLDYFRTRNLTGEETIILATKNRIRPIFMSTLTSVCGMMPLVLFPGAGSELYRGLGSVVVGGLSMSALLTLFMVPPLTAILLLPIENRRRKKKASSKSAAEVSPASTT